MRATPKKEFASTLRRKLRGNDRSCVSVESGHLILRQITRALPRRGYGNDCFFTQSKWNLSSRFPNKNFESMAKQIAEMLIESVTMELPDTKT
ncbi:MAG: hypothetical protein ABI042_05965, partial [Verrucomicrobiota bacterium]